MTTIRVNGHQVEMNEQGLYRLDTVYKALQTDELKQSATPAFLQAMKPIEYLESRPAKRLAEKLVDCGKLAYAVEVKPGGSCFISREMLIGYATCYAPKLLISLISQLVDQKDPYVPESELMTAFWDEFDFLEEHGGGFDHSHNPSIIAINTKQVLREIVKERFPHINKYQFTEALKNSQRYLFLETGSVNSKLWGHNVWCFKFKRG